VAVVLVMATAVVVVVVVVERDLKSAANGTVNFPSKELLPSSSSLLLEYCQGRSSRDVRQHRHWGLLIKDGSSMRSAR